MKCLIDEAEKNNFRKCYTKMPRWRLLVMMTLFTDRESQGSLGKHVGSKVIYPTPTPLIALHLSISS